jgi:hypothetical protein
MDCERTTFTLEFNVEELKLLYLLLYDEATRGGPDTITGRLAKEMMDSLPATIRP